ncbi:MAG: hypothetical protein RL220_165 [Bacteroidota bacterium]|jgi:hypothetical protein
MKSLLTTLFLALTSTLVLAKAVDEKHVFLHGKVFEVNPYSEEIEATAKSVQVVVYQDEEIYVAFYSDKAGNYEFNLPIGHLYKVRFGGTEYVNKILQIDTRDVPARKNGNDLDIDMGLFKPVDGGDFSMLNEPYVIVFWDKEYNRLVPDLAYTDDKAYELDKVFRRIRKSKKDGH